MGLDFSRPAPGAIQAQNPAREEQEDYQQYDIAPYSTGITEFLLPFSGTDS